MKNTYHSTRHIPLKLLHMVLLSLLVYLLAFSLAHAQSEQVVVPLSKPGQPGKLRVQLITGSISVQGYEGKEVIVKIGGDTEDGRSRRSDEAQKNGMRRIGNRSFGLKIVEENNQVYIDTEIPGRNMHIQVQVPMHFSVTAETVNDGSIRIENIRGEVEASNINGPVYLKNINGAAVVNTVNGELKATFLQVKPDTPMSFTSLNGDIDVTFPAATKMQTSMRSLNGEIYTDFDMDVNVANSKKTSGSGGIYKVEINSQVTGKVNGGGPEMYFETHNGNIYIRQKK